METNYPWIPAYCLEKKGAVQEYKAEWEAERFLIGGKMFAMLGGDKTGKPIFTIKLEPAFGQFLRAQYPKVVPGYYMNKEHWNSLYLDADVPDETVREMIDQAYRLVLSSLPKKKQAEFLQV